MKTKAHILLTGGHGATTALAIIEQLKKDPRVDWNISWVGPNRSLEGARSLPFEVSLFPKLGVPVYTLNAGKLQSKFTRYTIPALLRLPLGFWQAFNLINKIRPQIVLSFGGYAAFPVIFVAWLLRIPVCLQEQIVGGGLSNKMSKFFACKIAVSREESLSVFPREKTFVLGNPLTNEVLSVPKKKKINKLPVIYVTGGSRGAQRINSQIFTLLPKLLTKFEVIHQTGSLDYTKAKDIKDSLPKSLEKRYQIYDFVSPLEVYKLYDRADILVSRAGANTVSEATTIGIPSIFIPIPWSIGDEQTKNARYSVKVGNGLLLPEVELDANRLFERIDYVFNNWNKMTRSSDVDRNAASEVRKLLNSCIS